MFTPIHLEQSWLKHLLPEFDKLYMQQIEVFLEEREAQGHHIYPAQDQYFNALNNTPLSRVKIVILGQDPYHGMKQAHGLSFSVPVGVKIPPSLRNIYKELQDDLGVPMASHGNLIHWAEQGVLLLNSVLTVEDGRAGAHQNKGWERFTDVVIDTVNSECEHVVFMLWGAYAQKKGANINGNKHLILHAPHPSPLSAHRGFFGCKHFSKANAYIQQHGLEPIHWGLPSLEKTLQLF